MEIIKKSPNNNATDIGETSEKPLFNILLFILYAFLSMCNRFSLVLKKKLTSRYEMD